LWLIDLLGRGGSYVNGEQVEFALLQRGDVLSVGAFHLRVETGHMKPLTGPASAQLKNPPPSAEEDSHVNGNSAHMQHEDVSTQQLQAIKTEEDSSKSGSVDPVNVLHEDPQDDSKKEGSGADSSIIDGDDPSRWGEIIEALKSGGFGT
jgi:predicted component of type VI protein secretion system